ncbi:MAG: LptA/OstA family protein [Candidatus Omnitrophica bacterium]|nr:LptA/OstA family protein [Candidatus Omnitrophota bacterium]
MKKLFFLLVMLSLPLTATASEAVLPVDINADEINYLQEEGTAIAKGNVKLIYKDTQLFADEATYDAKKQTVHIKGNVKIIKEGTTAYGSDVIYDFNTQNAQMSDVTLVSPPMYGGAKEANKIGAEKYVLNEGYMTTCNKEHPHYRIVAKHLTFYPGVKVVAKNVVIKVGSTPVFYVPYFSMPLDDGSFPLEFIPGSSEEWGYYILNRWRYHLNQQHRGKLIFDWYSKRGAGVGILHKAQGTKVGDAVLNVYAIEDKLNKLQERDTLFKEFPERKDATSKNLEDDRYKIQFYHSWRPSNNLSMRMELQKFSDPFFMKDFFKSEYEKEPHPLSYSFIDYSFSNSSLSLLTQKRMNDFFTETEYLPQLEYDFYRQQLGSSNFYFESQSTAGNLGYRVADEETHYEAGRLHTHNTISYAQNIKWLYINPFAGGYTTLYSKDLTEREGVVRVAPETGINFSTKLYRNFDTSFDFGSEKITQMRHILTPTLSYSYIFPPTVSKNRVFQFDDIDALGRHEKIKLTLDNKIKARSDRRTWDFIYFSPAVEYSVKKEGIKGSFFDKITSDFEIYPKGWLSFTARNEYDCVDRALTELNTDFSIRDPKTEKYTLSLGHRYLRSESSQATLDFKYQLTQKVQFKNYLRYEYKEKRFQEQQYALRTDLHCWWLDTGVTIDHRNNYTLWFALVCKDFPSLHIGFDQTYSGAQKSY